MKTEIQPTDSTPKIILDFDENIIEISGESYPEDVNAFYSKPMAMINEHLKSVSGITLTVNLNLKYFNSSSTKVFYNMFHALEDATEKNTIIINWQYHEDDEMAAETGQEYSEDLEHVHFNLVPYN